MGAEDSLLNETKNRAERRSQISKLSSVLIDADQTTEFLHVSRDAVSQADDELAHDSPFLNGEAFGSAVSRLAETSSVINQEFSDACSQFFDGMGDDEIAKYVDESLGLLTWQRLIFLYGLMRATVEETAEQQIAVREVESSSEKMTILNKATSALQEIAVRKPKQVPDIVAEKVPNSRDEQRNYLNQIFNALTAFQRVVSSLFPDREHAVAALADSYRFGGDSFFGPTDEFDGMDKQPKITLLLSLIVDAFEDN